MSERELTREDIVITGSDFEEAPSAHLFGEPVDIALGENGTRSP